MANLGSLIQAFAISFMIVCVPVVYGQINSPCTASMLTSFNPCVSFITGGSNITQPPPDCCSSIKSLMSNGSDCLCQIATGTIFFRVPINRTLAISLPRACNMPNVTLQCKPSGSGSPAAAPAPGPSVSGPDMAPGLAPSLSPQASLPPLAPGVDSTPALTPASSEAPTSDSERPQSQNPAASSAFPISFSPLLLLAAFGALY